MQQQVRSFISGEHVQRNPFLQSASVYPGILLADGTDVFVRVVSKGKEPSRQLKVLRYLADPELSSNAQNHAIPVLQELTYEDWTFVAMPRYEDAPVARPYPRQRQWFTTVAELLDFTVQVLEVLNRPAPCHVLSVDTA